MLQCLLRHLVIFVALTFSLDLSVSFVESAGAIGESNEKQWPDGYVAICSVAKDQHRDIREWVEYHQWIGVKKIYIYDNNSSTPLASTIPDYLQSGLVEYSYFLGKPRYLDYWNTSRQAHVYRECFHRYRHRHRFIALIDVDEFIVLHDTFKPDINGFMRQFEGYGGLAVNWVIFGSNGYKRRPRGGALINYSKCVPLWQKESRHVKVIVNTAYFKDASGDPHSVQYNRPDATSVSENFLVVSSSHSKVASQKRIALYHYLLKSEDEYREKINRGSAADNHKTMEFFYAVDELANQTCTFAIPLGYKCCPSVLAELQEGVEHPT